MHPRDDSIDSLLDDLATETSNAYKKLPSLRSAKRISSSNDLKQDHSVDELLKELELDLNAVAPSSDRQNVSVEVTLRAAQNSEMLSAGSPAASPAKRKCSPVCIGGTQDEVGITAATPTTAARFWRTCDMIRCLSCDFRCLKFPNAMWTTRVDYMFFRNYVPDERKLASGLERKDGYQAYCCQCSWVSVNALARVNALPNCDKFKWVCGGHFP
ncbi:retinal maintenance-domain-containing protein [Zopfochytrium polystomum]|nr:retinal maintenance-domain-containing protein [Zopfochytrium polystomum]